MRDRGRGGIVFVGSMSGMAGQALEATYSAAKRSASTSPKRSGVSCASTMWTS